MRYLAVALLVIAAWAGDFGAHMWLDADYADAWEAFGAVVTVWGALMLSWFAHDDARKADR
jgi:hypothetical protein